MHSDEFLKSRKADWENLSHLLDRCESNLQRMSPDEIRRLGYLYRATTSDLAIAQRDFPYDRVTNYLNTLVARAHAVIYRSEPLPYHRLWNFVTNGFPHAFRQTFPMIALATGVFLICSLAAGLSTALAPNSACWLLPAQMQDTIPLIEKKELWTNIPIGERPYASSFIMQNNIQVAFLAFGSGILGGLPSMWVLVENGLILGGLLGLTIHYGVGFELSTFVIGHGVIELSVIFIAAGCGISLGWAVIHPGLLRRQDALTLAARRTVRLLIGCIPLLMIAGTIEGFLSPAEGVPPEVKWTVGICSGILLYAYLFLAGRKESPSRSA